MRTPQIRPWVLTDFGCRVLNLHILRTSVQGDLTPPRSNNNTNTTAQTLSSERKHSRGSDDPLTALKKGAVLLRNGDNYYSRPKTQDFQEFCPGPPGSSQNPPFGSSSPHVLGKVVGSSIPQPRYLLIYNYTHGFLVILLYYTHSESSCHLSYFIIMLTLIIQQLNARVCVLVSSMREKIRNVKKKRCVLWIVNVMPYMPYVIYGIL